MLEQLIEVIKILLLAFTIVRFEPISMVLDIIDPIIKNKLLRVIFDSISVAITCFKCASLYIGLILFGFWPAIIASVIAYFYDKLLHSKVETIRFR